jgi:dienelactone hydrolase
MRRESLIVLAVVTSFVWNVALGQEAVSFKAADGVQVFAEFYSTGDTAKPIVLLFHQADYNKEEYSKIAPHLVEAGFNALAIDHRRGGDSYGGENLTVKTLGKSTGYLETLPDLEAAVTWAEDEGYKTIIVWGSSYSSSLVFLLAAEYPEIAGVLSFSPGEYFSKASLVQDAAAKVTVPVFITSDGSQGEVSKAHTIFAAVASPDKVEFEPDGIGFHGSFALLQGPLKDEYWTAVLAFLEKFK